MVSCTIGRNPLPMINLSSNEWFKPMTKLQLQERSFLKYDVLPCVEEGQQYGVRIPPTLSYTRRHYLTKNLLKFEIKPSSTEKGRCTKKPRDHSIRVTIITVTIITVTIIAMLVCSLLDVGLTHV
jgi:hypothetical protein